jgi:DNA polymerase-3 subunit epsilon
LKSVVIQAKERDQRFAAKKGDRRANPRGRDVCGGLPGAERYDARRIPPGFYSNTRLRRFGFKPGGPPRGYTRALGSGKLIPLYDVLEAVPRHRLKQSQLWVVNKVRARVQAIARARALTESSAVILDTETTGIGRDAEIIEIAIVDAEGEKLFDTLVRPQRPIPQEATAIHQLRDEDVVGAPPWPVVWPSIVEILANREVVAYNASFDMAMIARTCERYSLKAVEAKWECLMLLYWKQFQFAEKFRSLKRACENERLLCGNHRALADAVAAQRLLRVIATSPTRSLFGVAA